MPKLTLVFNVFNKASTLAGVLSSWLNTLSLAYWYEVIVVCDDCHDGSHGVADAVLEAYQDRLRRWMVVDTPNWYEIASNNYALSLAAPDSDLIVFIQDDNTQHDHAWDAHLIEARALVADPGATAMLAGGIFLKNGFSYRRIESQRPHKGDQFTKHLIPEDEYPPAVYAVDFVTRPFAVSTPLLRALGGLGGEGWDVVCWDDTDLSIKLLRKGYTNQYLSLDVLNTSDGLKTMPDVMRRGFEHNHKLFLDAHQEWLKARDGNTFAFLAPLVWATTREKV